MIYKFTVISDEVDDFIREIKIDSDATFYDLHGCILKSVGYKDDQMTSFFICDDSGEKEKEVTLEDMGSSSDEDVWVMRDTQLSELLEDEKQKLLYVFDPLNERVFFMELTEIIPGEDLADPICSYKQGNPPAQIVDYEDYANKHNADMDLDESFYGDESYDPEEFDADGFMDESSMSDYGDDDKY